MKKRKSKFLFVAGDSCLDFLNTRLIEKHEPVDRLENFGDLVDWLMESGILGSRFPVRAARRWENRETQQALHEARRFREVLRKMIVKITKGDRVPGTAVHEIDRFLRLRKGHASLVRQPSGFVRVFLDRSDHPLDLLAPIAEAATDLLCSADFSLIKKCENEACILYFYDTTKNHARRWCSMKACGNRNKVAAYYRRRRNKN